MAERKSYHKNIELKKYNNRTSKQVHGKQTQGKSPKKKSVCPIADKCGGCQYLDIPYKEQIETKQKYLEKLFGQYCTPEKIISMKNPLHYRHKVHAVFHHNRRGEIISGVYEEGTHNVLPVNTCMIEHEKADAIIGTIRSLLKSFKITVHNEDTGYGILRHVLIRMGYNSGQIMVVLVTSTPMFPSKKNFAKALLKEHPEITTVVQNINDKRTSMVLGTRDQVIYGKGFIEDTLCGKTFRISPQSFYQVNPEQTEHLYNMAIDYANLRGDEVVLDAYCGTGTIGIILSDHVNEVIGVELNKDAVRDAVINAKRNDAKNVTFYNQDAGKFMLGLAAQKKEIDVVIMDPPRSGSDDTFLNTVRELAPKKIVYVSCGPESLARDLKTLTKCGMYKVEKLGAVDMFPQTVGIESVVLLVRVN